MKKLIAATTLMLSMSALASDQTISGALSKIEFENNAVCDYVDSSSRFNFMSWSWYSEEYVCVGNSRIFNAKLKIRQKREIVGTQDGMRFKNKSGSKVVTKITIE
ncbi:MAG: hypothetical protein CME64_15755 [Halobacteriovoraceae bacterium]|nr:hypothetical protein [Halobacteriovoraceae bacterium]|tara:strand:+ start:704 stop:1018 length:315 start_codon:yes stop_codon:yes gene_type:complete